MDEQKNLQNDPYCWDSQSSSEQYESLTDEELVRLAQAGDGEALPFLLDKYKNFIRDYNPEKLTTFRAFAELCVKRQIITAIKTATRQKHYALNSYVSLNKPLYDEESDRTLLDVLEGRVTNPEDLYISQEDLSHIETQIDSMLSDLEQQVLQCFLDGSSYQEIAEELGRHVKSIDNALQRVKRKLTKLLEEKKKMDQME